MNIKQKAILATLMVVILLATTGGIVYASDSAKPGDLLFSVDKVIEQVQRSLTTDPIAKSKLEMKLWEERLDELNILSTSNNPKVVSAAIGEFKDQQNVLHENLKSLDELRVNSKVSAEDEEKILSEIRTKVNDNQTLISRVQGQLASNGDSTNSNDLTEVNSQNTQVLDNNTQKFESDTGLKVESNNSKSENETESLDKSNSSQTVISRTSRSSESESELEREDRSEEEGSTSSKSISSVKSFSTVSTVSSSEE